MATRRKVKKPNALGIGCLGVFGLIWMGSVLTFDMFLLSGVWKTHVASKDYVAAQGVVTESYVKTTSHNEGRSHTPIVEYSYDVNGTSWAGDNPSYHAFGMSSNKDAAKTVAQFPVGKEITVYYDPNDPGESVLEIDHRSFPYMAVLLLTPFHCIGGAFIGGFIVSLMRARQGEDHATIAMYIVTQSKDRLVLQDAHWSWWAVFLAVFGGTTFISIFLVGIVLKKESDKATMLWTWSICLALALFTPGLLQLWRGGKHRKLVLDWHHGRFTRKPDSINIPIESIKTIRLTIHNINTEVNGKPWYKHELEAVDENDQSHRLLIAKGHKGRGEDLRDWFAKRFEAATEDRGDGLEDDPSMPIVSEVEVNRTNS